MLKIIVFLTYLVFLAYQCNDYSTIISLNHTLNLNGIVTRTPTLSLEISIWPSYWPPLAELARQRNLHTQIFPFLSNSTIPNLQKYRRIPTSSLLPILISPDPFAKFWNPTILALPSYSPYRYLVLSRVLTDGSHHINIACLANWTYNDKKTLPEASIKALTCDPTTLQLLNIPPTISKDCTRKEARIHYEHFPGFHDSRISWMRNGDVLVVAGSGSLVSCFGMHAFSLLPYYHRLSNLISNATPFGLGPHLTFPHITELERPPPFEFFEKNWIPFHSASGLYFQSDHSPERRTVAKHYGFGKIGSTITSYGEPNCFPPDLGNESGKGSSKWHLGTGVLEVMLCKRGEECQGKGSVFVGIIHRKITNKLGLMAGSGKYEKFVVVYDGKAPFQTLAFGRRAILFGEEREDGFIDMLSGEVVGKNGFAGTLKGEGEAQYRKTFTYTLSLAWDIHDKADTADGMVVGYLDDDIVAGVGVGDNGVFVGRVKMADLLKDLREC